MQADDIIKSWVNTITISSIICISTRCFQFSHRFPIVPASLCQMDVTLQTLLFHMLYQQFIQGLLKLIRHGFEVRVSNLIYVALSFDAVSPLKLLRCQLHLLE